MEKGTYGYIRYYKKRKTIFTIVIAAIALVIFFGGYYISGKNNKNIYTVIAAVLMLPMAKYMVAVIIAIPFNTIPLDLYYEIELNKGNGCILYDLIITSGEKIMNIDCMYIADKQISLLVTKPKQNTEYMQDYIEEYLEGRMYNRHVIACTKKEDFYKEISGNVNSRKDENDEIVKELLVLQI